MFPHGPSFRVHKEIRPWLTWIDTENKQMGESRVSATGKESWCQRATIHLVSEWGTDVSQEKRKWLVCGVNHSASLASREMYRRASPGLHLTPVRMPVASEQRPSHTSEDVEKGNLHAAGRKVGWSRHCDSQHGGSPTKLKLEATGPRYAKSNPGQQTTTMLPDT